VFFLLGGCAGEKAPVPEEAPKAAAVGAVVPVEAVDPEQAALEKELAEEMQKRAHWRRIGDSAKEAEALIDVGLAQSLLGRKKEAIASLQEAQSIAKTVDYLPGEIRALRSLGVLFWKDDQPEEARRHLVEALGFARQLGDPGQQADLLHAIATSYYDQGRYSEALSSYQEALRLAESADERSSLVADILNGMGIVHSYRGEYDEERRCYDLALKQARRSGKNGLGAKAATLTSLGRFHRRRGELEPARDLFSEAVEINKVLKVPGDEAKVLNHLGGVYLDLGETRKALQEYGEAFEIHRSAENNDGAARALINIGQVHLVDERPDLALEQFQKAWELSRNGDKPRTTAAALHGIGVAQQRLGRTQEAIRILQDALPLRREAGDRLGEASTLLELGKAYQGRKELGPAETAMGKALDLARETRASFVQAAALLAQAELDRDRERLENALQKIEEAINILESVRSDLRGERLRSSFFASKRSYYDFYVDLLMRLDRHNPGRGYAAKALAASERGRVRSLLELLAEGRHEVTRGIDPELRRQESEVAAQLSQIQSELIEELSKKSLDEERVGLLRDRLQQAEEERETLERKIRVKHRRYAEVRYPSPLDLQEIQKHLEEDTALLEYSLGSEGSYLFLVTPDTLEVHSLPKARVIQDQVNRARKGMEAPGGLSFGQYLQAARWLHEKLVAPVRPRLNGKRLLLIAPDGPLYFLSFETLLTGNGGGRDPAALPYLLRDFALAYVPSASVLPLLSDPGNWDGAAKGNFKQFVAFADPDYGPAQVAQGTSRAPTRGASAARAGITGLSRLPRLKGSRIEVRQIADLYRPDDVMIYTGKNANEKHVKQNPLVETAKRLHFAAHGILNEERPALSGLRLTQAGGDDGLLQVYEIFNLDLDAELVVLSACESGLGKEVTGEGLVGVTRAFLYAGAPSVVVSLWRVRDDTAPDLMVDFYEELDQLGKAEALQRAKLTMIEGGRHAHPYYWAPFILVGKP
jgi:CHAT domain-containing protein/Flp pilus assembly protein TadD